MIDAAGQALLILMDVHRLMFLGLGVLLGIVVGILPGIGGLAGTALLLPFTVGMDTYTAFAFLLGLGATTATGDPIPAIMFGVPGGAGSAATVLDGLPMAKRGEAGRALSAAYMSSMLGGLFGAVLMGFTLPLLQPIVLYVGSPELLAFAVFGISAVAVLSGKAPLRGLVAACLGVMLAMIGADPQTGTLRWTLGSFYLWDGLPLMPLILGLFALPELCDLLIARTSISPTARYSIATGMLQGARDCFRNWWLVLRCSWIGAGFGIIPGIGGSVIDWLAYGHALRTEKDAAKTFGKGDVRGVIASESSNNAKEGGALIPTIAFGVPGSAGMAVLLGAFLFHGLVPGPDMLTKHLQLSYSMVWSIAIANVLGAGICYLFSGHFARLATLRYTLILPSVLGIIYIGAFEGSRSWGDLYALLLLGIFGWVMKQLNWPRAPLILGFVLGDTIERYLFISVERYGVDWFTRPLVILLFALAFYGLMRPLVQDIRALGGIRGVTSRFSPRPHFHASDLFTVALIALFAVMLWQASGWRQNAMIVPATVGGIALVLATISLLNRMFLPPVPAGLDAEGSARHEVGDRIHMDLESDTGHLPRRTVLLRASVFFGWLLGFMVSMALIGLIPTVPIFVVAFMRLEGREPWKLVLPQAIILTLFIYVLFDQIIHIPWPETVLGQMFPALRPFFPSM
ncbi:tripartite tricarboxylate transporter permease [Ancylobacter mangrovi]|uniref:Tripartite tricarboxylate transporter permease n=1 Tax=Ancylobacter mangrovi TaxID=2972472 RepID=A0A9X2PMN1_9HYPH|nr:tripartite tricarboxylate transporter permease [Ancylobacter mangrovi]MCS0496573.1 tripartite tricarboxylate transporter permease [Ancylobacter mangrovi]MCS0503744.1 tripartite tricarboxylate transporter permease [Ancylobacter mangrovi]